ncbi:glycoside hydrolase family 43 protein [Paenibacillus sp. CMAA1364]
MTKGVKNVEKRRITNPILPGFNPDPSILRVGEDYYIATSTFEWFPGVRIHHSKDLLHWKLLDRPLASRRLLDMRGNPSSGGVWAPCLSYSNGLFFLVYTDVKSYSGAYKDTHNYVITASSITGPWSDPVYLNSSGFDPSFFHDEDGHIWLLNMVWDHRKNRNPFHGIVLQEYSVAEKKLMGSKRLIFKGTELGCTEAPHLYKRNGYYYLMTAEGGTGYEHAVTMARSKEIEGPYELDPANPMLTSFGEPKLELQKAGHASLVETQSGEWYIAHLCSRPIAKLARSPLGRETALQRCEWTEDGWLRLASGTNQPQLDVQPPALAEYLQDPPDDRDEFDKEELSENWDTLRVPHDESWLTLKERPGFLRLRGRESLNSQHEQSLVARRLESLHSQMETKLEFEPTSFQQMAGLVVYYNNKHHYYLRVTHHEEAGKCLGIITSDNGVYDEPLPKEVSLGEAKEVHLRADVRQEVLQFSYSIDGQHWMQIGDPLDLSKLSDEYCTKFIDGTFTDWGFTGTFVGLCVQDLTGERMLADFDYFTYLKM